MWLRSRLATIDARSLIFHFAHIVRSFSFLIPYFLRPFLRPFSSKRPEVERGSKRAELERSFLILKLGVYWAATVAGFRASVVP